MEKPCTTNTNKKNNKKKLERISQEGKILKAAQGTVSAQKIKQVMSIINQSTGKFKELEYLNSEKKKLQNDYEKLLCDKKILINTFEHVLIFKGLLDSLLKNSKNKQIGENKDGYSKLNKTKTGFDDFKNLIDKLKEISTRSRSQSRNQSNKIKPVNNKEISKAFFTDSDIINLRKRKEIINSLIKSLTKMKEYLKKKRLVELKKDFLFKKSQEETKCIYNLSQFF